MVEHAADAGPQMCHRLEELWLLEAGCQRAVHKFNLRISYKQVNRDRRPRDQGRR